MISNYAQQVIDEFENRGNKEESVRMSKYMRNKFEYFGIKSALRREISKPFIAKTNLPSIDDVSKIVKDLWVQPQRELQYFAMELLEKYAKISPSTWIDLYQELITQKSWWDTVDGLAAWQVGGHFKKFPEQRSSYTDQWMNSGNLWLQRTCLIFQLRYKEQTDFELLKTFIVALASHKDFFIRKAIGWALRQYGKVNPEDVKVFVAQQELSNLSQKEALKHLS